MSREKDGQSWVNTTSGLTLYDLEQAGIDPNITTGKRRISHKPEQNKEQPTGRGNR